MLRALLLLPLVCLLGSAQALPETIEKLLAEPAARRAIWAVHVRDLASGQTVYERNSEVPFTPASNTKLFSSALALTKLGPDYRFQTQVLGAPPVQGTIRGDVVLLGGGDPTLSGRVYPYRKDSAWGDALAPLSLLADQVAASGVTRIDGDVVGDDSRYTWEPHPDGWTAGDTVWEYGAPVSALIVNDNAFRLTLHTPKRPGEAVTVALDPPFEYFTIQNTVRVGAGLPRRIEVDRLPGSRVLRIHGVTPPGAGLARLLLAVDDPALFAASAFKELLERRGVTVRGEARVRHRETGVPYVAPQGHVLASRESPPLVEILRVVNKVSQNLHAEIALRETAHTLRGEGSRSEGLKELDAFLGQVGIANDERDFLDASGLSRRTLVTPAAVTKLLAWMRASPQGEAFQGLLPVAGVDGTLATRYNGVSGQTDIQAKTGTLSHVSTLSGYAGGRLAFSVMVNHATSPSFEVRRLCDEIALEILRKGVD